MRPDTPLLHTEAKEEVKRALVAYARHRGVKDVLIYLASARLGWNELQRRAGLSPSDLADTIRRVREHVRSRLKGYLNG